MIDMATAGWPCASPRGRGGAQARQTGSRAPNVSCGASASVSASAPLSAVLAAEADHSAGIEHAAQCVDGNLVWKAGHGSVHDQSEKTEHRRASRCYLCLKYRQTEGKKYTSLSD
jgi:hypothetical protein